MRRTTPAAVLRALPEGARPLVEALLGEAERRDVGLLLVGGPVRDWLLERPLRDVDLIVEPEREIGAAELAREAVGSGDVRIVTHDRFGTVRIEAGQGEAGSPEEPTVVDVATVRSVSLRYLLCGRDA